MKPIFIVKLPATELDSVENPATYLNKIQTNLTKIIGKDYYVLVTTTIEEEIKFEAFYPKDFNEVSLIEVQKKIMGEVRGKGDFSAQTKK